MMRKAEVFPIEWLSRLSKGDGFLIDTNVWIRLNGPQVREDQKTRKYSDALKKARYAKSGVFVDILVLSEFINTYSRIKYKAWKPIPEASFKDFRSSTDYPAVAKDIANAVRGILKICRRINSGLESIDIEALLTDFDQKQRDFNDQVLAELCRSKNLALITDDRDFRGYGITVLTANPRMLKPDNEATRGAKTPSA